MRLFCLLSFLSLLVSPLFASIHWQTEYTVTKSQSQQEHKPMLLFFNGSDWAGIAMKMKHEVLDHPLFEERAGGRFIFMEVDFPKYSPVNESLSTQNLSLKNFFGIECFPTLLLLDENERVITHLGYLSETGEKLAEELVNILDQDRELVKGLQQLSSLSLPQIKQLYQLAQELRNDAAIEQIMEAGACKEDPYFYLERYRFLVENGEMENEQARALRQKLMLLDPEKVHINGQSMPFTVALIDFQELSQKVPEGDAAAQPLIDYLGKFKEKEPQNVWQVERMVAEIYLNAGKCEEALRHAESAYSSAPESVRSELAHSVNYIRQRAPFRR